MTLLLENGKQLVTSNFFLTRRSFFYNFQVFFLLKQNNLGLYVQQSYVDEILNKHFGFYKASSL